MLHLITCQDNASACGTLVIVSDEVSAVAVFFFFIFLN